MYGNGMTLTEKLEVAMRDKRAELIHQPLARVLGELAKTANNLVESEALTAFQRYKEEKWLDVSANTLNELLHLIQTKEYERGYKDGESSGYADWIAAVEERFDIQATGPQDFLTKIEHRIGNM